MSKPTDITIESFSSDDTRTLGRELGKKALPGQIYCLSGDLGAGKTVFTQGFAEGLGIKDVVNSPTFVILRQYMNGRLPLYHFDVYRIEDIGEMDETGCEDFFYGDGVTLIEWPSRIAPLLPPETIDVSLKRDEAKGFDYRKITVTGLLQDKG